MEDSKCYDNNPVNCDKYGRLYDWETATNACLPGWHLPTEAEWLELFDFAGGRKIAGKKLRAASGWNENDYNGKPGNGEDAFGFSALPGGGGDSSGYFGNVGYYGGWWSASEYGSDETYGRGGTTYYNDEADFSYTDKFQLWSVRCLQD
jgi:uncharacterized protein (TIGR02145 family)